MGQIPPEPPVGREEYPAICPRCGADWRGRDVIRSPIRAQRTGFQKIAPGIVRLAPSRLGQAPVVRRTKAGGVLRQPAGCGKAIRWHALLPLSRCAPASTRRLPWPGTAGGCRLSPHNAGDSNWTAPDQAIGERFCEDPSRGSNRALAMGLNSTTASTPWATDPSLTKSTSSSTNPPESHKWSLPGDPDCSERSRTHAF